ncbi:MinD/ParA family protein [uncultured Metabacillus sp.]|uniref:MinD/ParA family protein n=1 Tax=uncultured Metabacillus sp. TaxID=2860135 RepID=UPI00261A26AA|nr:MinD/ParA family protein [uncultured Metabacillus sp.]
MGNDQADKLRERLNAFHTKSKSIAVMSGKGGVGKSNFSLNFSLALQNVHKKVLLCDLDIGMGNIEILMGESSTFTIVDFFEKNLSLKETISTSVIGLDYLSGGTGLGTIFRMNDRKFQRFLRELEQIMKEYDFIIFDMGAGISEDSLLFLLSVDEIIVITTPEPTALTDAYAAIKHVCINHDSTAFSIVVNRALNHSTGAAAFSRLQQTMSQFLKREASLLGIIPDDSAILKAVIAQKPFIVYQPSSQASKVISKMSKEYLKNQTFIFTEAEQAPFISKLKSFFVRGR